MKFVLRNAKYELLQIITIIAVFAYFTGKEGLLSLFEAVVVSCGWLIQIAYTFFKWDILILILKIILGI
ncbi:MAG TPA: hypothetical protein PKJ91_00280 [Methanoregulaceae archaeon]|nr:hypothetical protein [Methanoregulaceae archaeon]